MKEEILGVKIDAVNEAEAMKLVGQFVDGSKSNYVVTVNPEFIVLAQKDNEFKQILDEADLAIPDGVGVVFASKILGKNLIKNRIAGVDFVEKICSNLSGRKIFLLGALEGVARKAVSNLSLKYPNNQYAFLDGEGANSAEKAIESINQFKADILFVAFGAPRQEKWIYEHLKELKSVKLAIGVGGTLDYIARNKRRAPLVLIRMGLEWLWRLAYEPKRVRRIINAVFVFPYLVLKNHIKH